MSIFIIAEAGVNHNGNIDIARSLIDIASSAGADAVKFQTFKASKMVTRDAEQADYQKIENKNSNLSQLEMLKKLELSLDDHRVLISYCKEKKILFLSSPFDIDSIHLLNDLGVQIFKIPSGELTNLPYLRAVGLLNKKIILSTGMANMLEIKAAVGVLIISGTKKENITVLHANTMYPTPMSDVNLTAMNVIANSLSISVGYSDHTLGIEVSIAAAALGAKVIEKHFTIDSTMDGPDHKASLNPHELNEMILAIRNIEIALGDGFKQPSISEKSNIKHARKSIVAKTPIKKGEILSEDNLTVKRPGSGLSPMMWDSIIGIVARKNYQVDEII